MSLTTIPSFPAESQQCAPTYKVSLLYRIRISVCSVAGSPVSGIFWNRLGDDFPLQSCATLAYFLDVDKIQFSIEETKIESPYNTYINPGLPPGPISNPGIASIRAAANPQDSEYYYFLNDAETGEIVFSRTNEEHAANKIKHGL